MNQHGQLPLNVQKHSYARLGNGKLTKTNMNELIENVLQWGIDKNIIGTNGKGTRYGQADKVLEEAKETYGAVRRNDIIEVKDGIGDTMVTLILLANMYGWTLEECLQVAYDVISKRTGKMVDGVFVKDRGGE
jgi:phosphoribosyl-ATP pyrophosphohydrolase